jgi:hydrogenase expression/formation protein HypE
MVSRLLAEFGAAIHVLRDPTRGGVATTLKEIALQSGVDICLAEESLPINDAVAGACAILGLDPLFVANEGKLLAIVAADVADAVLARMRSCEFGEMSTIVGEVLEVSAGRVMMRTAIGGLRAIEMLAGEQLPRIC